MKQVSKGNILAAALLLAQLIASIIVAFIPVITGRELDVSASMALFQFLALIVPLAFYFGVTMESPRTGLSIRGVSPANCLFVIALTFLTIPAAYLLSALSALIAPNEIGAVVDDWFSNSSNVIIPALTLSAIPAICEELAFRGALLSAYKKTGIARAALFNGLFFAMLHLNIQQFLYTFALGIVFSFFVHRTKSIFSSMLAHFTFNGTQTLLYIAISQIEIAEGTAEEAAAPTFAEMAPAIIVLGVFAVFAGIAFFFLYRAFARYNEKRDAARAEIIAAPEQTEPVFSWTIALPVAAYAAIMFLLSYASKAAG